MRIIVCCGFLSDSSNFNSLCLHLRGGWQTRVTDVSSYSLNNIFYYFISRDVTYSYFTHLSDHNDDIRDSYRNSKSNQNNSDISKISQVKIEKEKRHERIKGKYLILDDVPYSYEQVKERQQSNTIPLIGETSRGRNEKTVKL